MTKNSGHKSIVGKIRKVNNILVVQVCVEGSRRFSVVTMTSRYSTPWDDSDVVFVIEDVEFHCHHTILKLNSPVFRTMFEGNFKENKSTPVPLPGKEILPFKLFLDLLYPIEVLPEAPQHVIGTILMYCNEYEVKSAIQHIDLMLEKLFRRKDYDYDDHVEFTMMRDLHLCDGGLKRAMVPVMDNVCQLDVHAFIEGEYERLSVETRLKLYVKLVHRLNSEGGKTPNREKLVKSLTKEFLNSIF